MWIGRTSRRLYLVAVLLAFASLGVATDPATGGIDVTVEPLAATVGDRLDTRITVNVDAGVEFRPPTIGPEIGPFHVLEGAWERDPATRGQEDDGAARWVWHGQLAVYRPGEHELPPFTFQLLGEEGAESTRSEAITVTIGSILEESASGPAGPELSDLKPPASLEADYGPLLTALGVLAALLVIAGVVWWLHRRYAEKLSAVPMPDDPFHRQPPHEWVYGELKRLLERQLPESGEVQLFYDELSRILKRYLGGRYRVDLLERTTGEVSEALHQAGAADDVLDEVTGFLDVCDSVKFAKEQPGSDAWREAVERCYRIVDRTRPAEASAKPADRGAA